MDKARKGLPRLQVPPEAHVYPRCYRVLMVAPTSFFADYGCHVRIYEEAHVLQRLGQHITIVTYHSGQSVPGLDIRRTLPVPWRRNYEVGSSRHKIGLDALLGLKTLQLLASEKFDVIHAHLHEGALIGTVLGRLFGLPVVFDFQGSMTGEMIDHGFLKRGSLVHAPLVKLERWLDRKARIVLTSSSHAGCLLVEQFGCQPDRIHTLPDCVNAEVFKPASEHDPAILAGLRQALGIPAERRLIVYLGLLAEYQGIGLLLQAMQVLAQQHNDVHLLLMGFPNVEQYRMRANELGIGSLVTFTGRVPYPTAPAYLALGDVAVSPKLSLTEGSGKILNYMAAGLPVVAFDTAVAREYLGPEAVLAIPGDAGSLAMKLETCLFPPHQQPDLYRRAGLRLRQRAIQLYSWEKVGRQILDAYALLLGDEPAVALSRRKWAISGK